MSVSGACEIHTLHLLHGVRLELDDRVGEIRVLENELGVDVEDAVDGRGVEA